MTDRAPSTNISCGNLLVCVGTRTESINWSYPSVCMSKCDPECGLHLKVDVSVDGQDSPYQVAAPCWLAELTLKVNMLKMTVIMLLMTFIEPGRVSVAVAIVSVASTVATCPHIDCAPAFTPSLSFCHNFHSPSSPTLLHTLLKCQTSESARPFYCLAVIIWSPRR